MSWIGNGLIIERRGCGCGFRHCATVHLIVSYCSAYVASLLIGFMLEQLDHLKKNCPSLIKFRLVSPRFLGKSCRLNNLGTANIYSLEELMFK